MTWFFTVISPHSDDVDACKKHLAELIGTTTERDDLYITEEYGAGGDHTHWNIVQDCRAKRTDRVTERHKRQLLKHHVENMSSATVRTRPVPAFDGLMDYITKESNHKQICGNKEVFAAALERHKQAEGEFKKTDGTWSKKKITFSQMPKFFIWFKKHHKLQPCSTQKVIHEIIRADYEIHHLTGGKWKQIQIAIDALEGIKDPDRDYRPEDTEKHFNW